MTESLNISQEPLRVKSLSEYIVLAQGKEGTNHIHVQLSPNSHYSRTEKRCKNLAGTLGELITM
ncbi:hypothetical protein DPMN_112049 [Dreissena polymorpha]|uniref:Uncharacterized protein n=1 Tax=Dreissena polymorpha TaxID=45954 RepID=A0A9D4KEY3_DREPO|nr:hypothetical protein DPMN_112049 [Dreissena polymorpha]